MLRRVVLWAAIVWAALLILGTGHGSATEEAPDPPLHQDWVDEVYVPVGLHAEVRQRERQRRKQQDL